MIRLDEVSKKLQDILNGSDEEVENLNLPVSAPTEFSFVVNTEGFHLDHIANMATGRNFIPVFVSSMGGNFNPVPDLLQANYVIPITFYFPVRFKNEAFALNEYLAQVFVGRQLNYGSHSGKAISNISVAQYGEIVDLDLKEFLGWVETNYKIRMDVREPFIQMTISLYLGSAAQDLVYGNDATATLTLEGEDDEEDITEPITFAQGSIQSNSDPATQQIMDTKEIEGLPTGTSYGQSFSIYIKTSELFQKLLSCWFDEEKEMPKITLSLAFSSFPDVVYTRECFMQSANMVIQKGELATITMAFVKKAVVDDGGL